MHSGWPMPSHAEAMNPESARRLTTSLDYKEATHQDGAGAAMPEENIRCTSTTARGGVAFAIPFGSEKWGMEIGLSDIAATCTGGAEPTKSVSVATLTINDQPVPANLSEIKGKKTITASDGRQYTVTYSLKPGTRD
jgi:hypothetical protein